MLEKQLQISPHYLNLGTTMMLLCCLTVFMIVLRNCASQSIAPLDDKMQVHALEGERADLSCKYEKASYLFWYRQYPGSRPEYLLTIIPSTKHVIRASSLLQRLNAAVDENRVDLLISSAAVSDSALYYCAMEPTVTGNPATLYKNCFLKLTHAGQCCYQQGELFVFIHLDFQLFKPPG
ncbi:hypothetical protein MHYP_G00005300 [Metynnis hypsauchen]